MPSSTSPSRPEPAYLTIAAELRAQIERGELTAHAHVPSERELGRSFGVSRMTARQAVNQLAREGYVYRRVPHGTFVADPRIPLRIGSFTDEIARIGRQPGAEVVWAETHEPSSAVREALELPHGQRVHALQRVRRADNEPLAVETTYIPEHLCPEMLDGPLDGSLWAILRDRAGIVPVRAAATMESVVITDQAAKQLDVTPGTSGMLLRRRTFDATGRCFEVARDLYRGDRAEFHIDAAIPRGAIGAEPMNLVTLRDASAST